MIASLKSNCVTRRSKEEYALVNQPFSWPKDAKGRRPGVGHYIDTLLRYLTHTFFGPCLARYVQRI